MIRAAYTLHWHIEGSFLLLRYIDSFQMIEQCFSCIPWHVVGFLCDIVTFCCTYRNHNHILKSKSFCQILNIFFDFRKTLLAVIHEIHFIDREYKVFDSHQCTDTAVSSRLHEYTLLGIHKDNGKLRKGSAYCHVSCIFFVSWCVCHDKTSLVCRKIAVSHINGNALLTLCHQSVQKERIVDRASSGTNLAVQYQSFLLVCV